MPPPLLPRDPAPAALGPRHRSWLRSAAVVAALVALTVLLALRPWSETSGSTDPGLLELRSSRSLLLVLVAFLGRALVEVGLQVPLGFLSVLAFSRPVPRGGRFLGVGLPAFVLGVLLAAAALTVRLRPLAPLPGPLDLAFPSLGILVGTWAGMALLRGWRASWLFLPKLVLAVLALCALGALLLLLALEREPLPFSPSPVTSQQKRQAYARLREGRSVSRGSGEAREIRLEPEDLNLLLAWGLSLGEDGREDGRKARVTLSDGEATLEVSARVPRVGRYFNVVFTGSVRVEEGAVRLDAVGLQVGRVVVPRVVLQPLVGLAVAVVARDRRVQPLLQAVSRLDHDASSVTLVIHPRAIPRGLLVELLRGEARRPEDLEAVRLQVALLVAPGTPPPVSPDERFALAVRNAFGLARKRSRKASAVVQNRAALLALGMVLGTPKLQLLTGPFLDEAQARQVPATPGGAALHGRLDWSRHFTVSGALTVLSFEVASDAAGLFKEELDADGGSGFSFGDLLADRAGTTFAERATRDEASARALQERVAQGFRADDYVPAGADLPEGIPDAELQSRYGGVGGPGFNALALEIDRRLAARPAYR